MYATRVVAGLIAGAVGAVAGGAAAALVAILLHGDLTRDPFPADQNRTYRLPVAVFVLVFLPVMAFAFRALEHSGFVGDPATRPNTLGLSDRPTDPCDDGDLGRRS